MERNLQWKNESQNLPMSFSEMDFEAAHTLMTLSNSHMGIHPISPHPFTPTTRKRIASSKSDDFSTELEGSNVERSFPCKSCSRGFSSFQALGGHRASCSNNGRKEMDGAEQLQFQEGKSNGDPIGLEYFNGDPARAPPFPNLGSEGSKKRRMKKAKVHKCTVCDREFSSGQALGGHQGSHRVIVPMVKASTSSTLSSVENTQIVKSVCLVDLNMPAPLDPEDEPENPNQILQSHLQQRFGLGLGRSQWGSPDFHQHGEAYCEIRVQKFPQLHNFLQ